MEEGFLQGLNANPQDDSLRLVYADWLEDRGDHRAEFLRVAVSLRNLAACDERFPALFDRLEVLRPTQSVTWLTRAIRGLAEDEIRAAVFQKVLGEDTLSGAFLQVEGNEDPSPYLLAHLSKRYTGLQPSSAAVTSGEGVFDKRTGERGCLVSVQSLEWVSADLCKVEESCFWDGLGATGNLHRVGIKNGFFTVVESINTWIS